MIVKWAVLLPGLREVPRILWRLIVAKCQLTGKGYLSGHIVSHSNSKSNTRRHANIQSKRVWDPVAGRFVRMQISTRALRTLARKGWDAFKK